MVGLIAYYMIFNREIILLVITVGGGAAIASLERNAGRIKEELKKRDQLNS